MFYIYAAKLGDGKWAQRWILLGLLIFFILFFSLIKTQKFCHWINKKNATLI